MAVDGLNMKDQELVDAYKAFQDQQRQFRSLYYKDNSSPFPKWLKGSDLHMIYINPAYEQTFKVSASDYVGKNDFSIWPEKVATRFREHDRRVIDEGQRIEVLETVAHPDTGEDWPLFVVKFPVVGDGFIGVGGSCVPLPKILATARDGLGVDQLCKMIEG